MEVFLYFKYCSLLRFSYLIKKFCKKDLNLFFLFALVGLWFELACLDSAWLLLLLKCVAWLDSAKWLESLELFKLFARLDSFELLEVLDSLAKHSCACPPPY